ncbi:hypothetical protein T459_08398 [Capsicum annuum]|uniref:Uncharacterized protein n=1 Tax=Capsicum annuum TaxID=4072 RepID=A0A2G2ZWC8_CAPAN|nr:hypothetical protein T459_08398 [Capsicum annuum]
MYECCSEVDSTIVERGCNVIPRSFNWKVVGIKVKYEKFMADRSGKRHAVDIHTQSDMDHQGFKDFSTIPPPEILMKAGLNTHASASQPTKKRRTVRFDTTTIPMQDSEKTPPSVSGKSHQDSSEQKWNELKFFLQSYQQDQQDQDVKCLQKEDVPSKEQDNELGGFTTGGVSSIDNFEEMDIITSSKDKGKKNFKGFSSDVGTSTLDAQVEEMVNQELEDIGTATLNALIDAVVNQNSDYSKVQNPMTENIREDHSDEYLSTILESAQLEIDAIMQGLASPVDDIPLEVAKLVDEIVNLHSLSDDQIPSNYPDSVVAAYLAAKIPAKRTRTRFRIFKSPYTTNFASGSKALEDESTEFKQTFAFEGYGISEDMLSSIIEEYKK